MDNIRDILIIATLIFFSTLVIITIIAIAISGRKTLNILRRANNLTDDKIVSFLGSNQDRIVKWNQKKRNPENIISIISSVNRWVQNRRRKKRKRRFDIRNLLSH
jgi:hypothetical protein